MFDIFFVVVSAFDTVYRFDADFLIDYVHMNFEILFITFRQEFSKMFIGQIDSFMSVKKIEYLFDILNN